MDTFKHVLHYSRHIVIICQIFICIWIYPHFKTSLTGVDTAFDFNLPTVNSETKTVRYIYCECMVQNQ